jgi:hypothetical protein
MYISQLMSPLLQRSLLLCGAVLSLGCDPTTGGRDASAPTSQRVSEVRVRIEAPSGGVPAVSVLAFRASVTGLPASDVLGVIDPVVASTTSRCELQEIGTPTDRLRGGRIDLEEVGPVSIALGSDTTLKSVPRVYPQLGSAVVGVLGEAGPMNLAALPDSIDVSLPGEETRFPLAIPGVPRLIDQNGEALAAGTRLDPNHDVQLNVVGPAHAVEIRPFGASRFIACPVGPGGRVLVSRDLLDRLKAAGSHGAVSFEAVWRDSRLAGAQATRLSIEARSSAVLDLRAQVASPADTAKPSLPTGP